MKIETNICDTVHTHDSIKYPSIESQLFGFFSTHFPDMGHTVTDSGLTFDIGGYQCPVEIGKKGVKVSIVQPQPPRIRFGEHAYPSVKLGYNKDLDKKIDKFCAAMRKIQDLEERALAVPKQAPEPVIAFLREQLETDVVTVSYWGDNLFSGIPITFYLHPRGSAPADGVIVCLDADYKITPWWNSSTQRRTMHYGEAEGIEKAVGCMLTQDERHAAKKLDLAGMKRKVAAVEELQAKVNAFDPNKSAAFLSLLAAKRQADQLVREFEAIQ